jgi:gentisate 1,2-dioxygenase
VAAEQFTDLEDFNQWLADRHMNGFWNSPRVAEDVKACLWKWDDVSRALDTSRELVPMDTVAMRTIQLRNPGLGVGMTKTLHFSVQSLAPGERTKAHRNLVSETRFVLKAKPGAIFIVDGEAFPMAPGDLITTPNWSWHDHYNGSDEPAVWIDCMDTRLVSTLGKSMNEPFPQLHQPVEKPAGYSARTLGHAKTAATMTERKAAPYQYPWADTQAAMDALRESEVEGDPADGFRLAFTNPLDGGPTYPTYSCEVQQLPSTWKGQAHRHNSTTIYHVFRGSGTTTIDDERFEWAQGDIFVVPPWVWHTHENAQSQDAILFSITDQPAVAALGLYREEQQ